MTTVRFDGRLRRLAARRAPSACTATWPPAESQWIDRATRTHDVLTGLDRATRGRHRRDTARRDRRAARVRRELAQARRVPSRSAPLGAALPRALAAHARRTRSCSTIDIDDRRARAADDAGGRRCGATSTRCTRSCASARCEDAGRRALRRLASPRPPHRRGWRRRSSSSASQRCAGRSSRRIDRRTGTARALTFTPGRAALGGADRRRARGPVADLLRRRSSTRRG